MKVRGTSSVTYPSLEVCTKYERSRAMYLALIISGILAHIMSCCDLDLSPLDLELLHHFGCHAFKLCTEFGTVLPINLQHCMTGQPSYLHQLLQDYQPTYSLRSASHDLLATTRPRSVTYHAFKHSAATTSLNSIPFIIRKIVTYYRYF